MKLLFPSSSSSHCTPPPHFPLRHLKPHLRRPFVRMDSSPVFHHRRKDKIVVVLGATGCGKSRLSIDLATRFPSEIINSDKMQVYNGLDITTNKITIPERRGVPHHLLGFVHPDDRDVSPSEFREAADWAISKIISCAKLPIVAGGSNSFIHALLVDRFNPEFNVFDGSDPVSTRLRYDCCFLWVDVSFPVLCEYLQQRVDEMLDSGMFEELAEYYESGKAADQPGLRKAIGVPEFEKYFKAYPPGSSYGGSGGGEKGEWGQVRRRKYEEAVREIKENTCQLAIRQIGKIQKLKGAGWDLHRVDATAAFREIMMTAVSNGVSVNNKKKKKKRKKKWMEIWERDVVQPSVKIVKHFLEE